MTDKKLPFFSRSTLAEKLGVTLKELTQVLIEAGWLLQKDDGQWVLTAKGEFEGGVYRDSKKFGRYIVWPEAVLVHPVIKELQQSRITASVLGKHFDISAKIINRLLAEMGWISAYAKGWQLTDIGKHNGGMQETHQDTGVPYVSWARQLLESTELAQRLALFVGNDTDAVEFQGRKVWQTLDGHYVSSLAELTIAHYLYLSGLVYAYQSQRVLSKECILLSDFYLLDKNIHIHYQPATVPPEQLSQQLERQALADKYGLQVITLTDNDIPSIESSLSKALLQFGITM